MGIDRACAEPWIHKNDLLMHLLLGSSWELRDSAGPAGIRLTSQAITKLSSTLAEGYRRGKA